MTFGEASTIEAEDSAPCPIGRPSSLDECEELLEYYEGLYEHGLEFIETARPFSVEKLKAKGIDFEKGDPSPLLAPPDATTWVGAISITREARVCIRFLEKVKKDMEAEEAAAGQEEQASQASPHKEPILRSMLAAIRAASVRTVQRLCAIYGAFMENAWRIWASTRSTEKATTGKPHLEAAHGVQSDEQRPLLDPLSGLSAEGLRQRLLREDVVRSGGLC